MRLAVGYRTEFRDQQLTQLRYSSDIFRLQLFFFPHVKEIECEAYYCSIAYTLFRLYRARNK
ncbi:hypothetical protein, partial [Aerosakkonema funiforme]|uniref:hypothetical protein n=1 Tax=Aerosakkonema funiforme TaxID=1246630 RepID=UPI0035BA4F00